MNKYFLYLLSSIIAVAPVCAGQETITKEVRPEDSTGQRIFNDACTAVEATLIAAGLCTLGLISGGLTHDASFLVAKAAENFFAHSQSQLITITGTIGVGLATSGLVAYLSIKGIKAMLKREEDVPGGPFYRLALSSAVIGAAVFALQLTVAGAKACLDS